MKLLTILELSDVMNIDTVEMVDIAIMEFAPISLMENLHVQID